MWLWSLDRWHVKRFCSTISDWWPCPVFKTWGGRGGRVVRVCRRTGSGSRRRWMWVQIRSETHLLNHQASRLLKIRARLDVVHDAPNFWPVFIYLLPSSLTFLLLRINSKNMHEKCPSIQINTFPHTCIMAGIEAFTVLTHCVTTLQCLLSATLHSLLWISLKKKLDLEWLPPPFWLRPLCQQSSGNAQGHQETTDGQT